MNPSKIYTFKELEQDELFDPITICKDTPFTQANFYGDWQRYFNRTVKRYLVKSNDEIIAYFQIIKYPLIFGKSYLYIPYGPIMKDSSFSLEFLENLKDKLIKIARELNSIFIRLDFTPTLDDDRLSIIKKLFKKAPLFTYHSAYFQPRIEWFLSLNKTEQELYQSMHENNRYSIRLAERKEIKAEVITYDFKKYFDDFYELITITSKRNGFGLHPKEYYKTIFDNLDKQNGFLVLAKFNEKILVIDLVIVYGEVANYVFACSSDEERNRAPSYGAIWKAIRYSKEIGCKYFNFGGISTEDQPNKNWIGLTNFKKKFGGFEVRHSDFYDLVVNKIIYFLYNIRKWIFYSINLC